VLAYFQGPVARWSAPSNEAMAALRQLVPTQRNRVFAALEVLGGVVDAGSSLELGAAHGQAVHTVLARLQGQAVGMVVSNPKHLGGALDAAACRKLTRFFGLCQQRGLPVASFIDTPGFMVGPEAETQGTVRDSGELFCAAAALTVPKAAVVLRRGFGLGAMALAFGGFHCPQFMAAWPSAEMGAMGLEGAVKLGYRKELEAVTDPSEREALFQQLLQHLIDQGGAIPMAETLELDAVIDPAQTRGCLLSALEASTPIA
jgi:acetyl-CoA carboxylase carboxyltransferase component